MRSETVSIINLQTLKSILKSVQNAPFLLLKFKIFWGGAQAPSHLFPLNSPPLDNTSGSATDDT